MQLSTIHFPFFFVVLKTLLKRFCASGLLVLLFPYCTVSSCASSLICTLTSSHCTSDSKLSSSCLSKHQYLYACTSSSDSFSFAVRLRLWPFNSPPRPQPCSETRTRSTTATNSSMSSRFPGRNFLHALSVVKCLTECASHLQTSFRVFLLLARTRFRSFRDPLPFLMPAQTNCSVCEWQRAVGDLVSIQTSLNLSCKSCCCDAN